MCCCPERSERSAGGVGKFGPVYTAAKQSSAGQSMPLNGFTSPVPPTGYT